MTKDQLWQIYLKKNPTMATKGLGPKGVRKLFLTTWDQACKTEADKRKTPSDKEIEDLLSQFDGTRMKPI